MCGALGNSWDNDLPEGFGPMTVKELRQGLRRGSFVLPFLAIQLLAIIATAAEFHLGQSAASMELVGALNLFLLLTSGPFWIVVAVICMVIMPLGGLALMGQELEEGNHELLQLTHLNRWKIVLGKFAALWGLSVVTFISLLPYVVVRYMVGGVEWWHEAACAATVLGGSAMIGAGAIGASAFKSVGGRIAVSLLFLASMFFGCGIPVAVSGIVTKGCGILYHLTAAVAVLSYTMVGLALARSRLRLAVMAYEVKPSGLFVALLGFAPFLVGMITALTAGFGGIAGLLLMGVAAVTMDNAPTSTAYGSRP